MTNFFPMYIKKIYPFFFIIAFLLINSITAAVAGRTSFTIKDTGTIEGRWDITIDIDGKKSPSWLEVHRSGLRTLVGEFVGTGGSARPVSKVNFTNGNVSFSIPPQWEKEDNDLVVKGILNGDSLSGTMMFSNGKVYNYVAYRAPELRRKDKPVWGKPITLFNGINLNGWHALGKNQWIVDSGFLRSPHSGANLVTDNTFNDFRLHIEFRYPRESNSGVYLRGRYEVQIEDTGGQEPIKNELGSIYGFLAPTKLVAKGAGQWQSYDITLIGRMVTVVVNGITVICNREIPGITGGAINSNEDQPGPLLIQGDHGPIDYRNIILTPSK
jgi:hypothetical protein